jgi:DNA ligase 1
VEEDDDDGDAIAGQEVKSPPKKSSRKARQVVVGDEDEMMEEIADPPQNSKQDAAVKPLKNAFASLGKKDGAGKAKVSDEVDEEAASESAAEVADEDEVQEEENDDEDEKPAAKAKAMKKIQSVLTTKINDAYPDWKPGEPVPYAALCQTFSLVELTTKRLIIMEYCSLFLRQVMRLTPDDLLPTVLLMINKLAPDYSGIELGIGESLIMKAIGESTGRSLATIKQDQKEIGDLGLVAVKSRSKQPTMIKPKPLTVAGVHKSLLAIATVTGSGAQGRKVDGIKKLLSAADSHAAVKVDITKDKGGPSEAKFIIRFLEGKLRLGLAERTVLVSLAQAVIAHEAIQKGATASTSDIEKAEAMLKTVYR